MSDASCVFCKIIAGQIPSQFIYADAHAVAFTDLNPQAPHHYLIVPRLHVSNLNAIDDTNRSAVAALLEVAAQVAKKQGLSGYRCVINTGKEGGQEVMHLHLHLLAGRPMQWPPG